jgi:hypothetical protein
MIIMMLILALCGPTTITNKSNESWNDMDQQNYELAVKCRRCEMYYKDSPCMKYFIKKEPLTYNVICGAAKK